MLKILYAAGNTESSKIQLSRFLHAIKDQPYIVKIAAFTISSPKNINIDWTLDCLLSIILPSAISTTSENFNTYFSQVKYFKPDLVISDFEYFTSHIANLLNIRLWQYSSSILYFATDKDKIKMGEFAKLTYLITRDHSVLSRQIYTLENAERIFVYSHLGDISEPPTLRNRFEWVRPYYNVGKISVPCHHNIISATLQNDRRLFALMQRYDDCVSFSEYPYETHSNIMMKNINNHSEYFCNVKNTNLFICNGHTSFLADAYYNDKYPVVLTKFKDVECVLNALYSSQFELSSTIYKIDENLDPFREKKIKSSINPQIKQLHEHISELM